MKVPFKGTNQQLQPIISSSVFNLNYFFNLFVVKQVHNIINVAQVLWCCQRMANMIEIGEIKEIGKSPETAVCACEEIYRIQQNFIILFIIILQASLLLASQRYELSNMGQLNHLCGQNVYKQLMEQYGNNLLKFLMAEKSKQIIKQKFMQLMNQAQKIITQIQEKITNIINQQIQLLSSIFEKVKSQIQDKLPGGIATVQRLKGESINKFSGFNGFMQNINRIKDSTVEKISQKKHQVSNDLQVHKNMMIKKIQDERPKIPLYEDLPSEIKRQLVKKAQKQLGSHLLENKETIIRSLQQNFVPNSYKMLGNFFNEVNPENPLCSITNNAFSTMSNNILGSSGNMANFGNFINKFF